MQQVNALPTQTLAIKDIHVPEPISNFPVAYGWWILAALLISIFVITFIKLKKLAKQNQVKKQALQQLKNTPNLPINDTIMLLKWAAMHYFSRAELAKLFGHSLQLFFTNTLPIKYQEKFKSLSEQAFLEQYKRDNDQTNEKVDENLTQAATLWLTHALPPKMKKITAENAMSDNKTKQGANT
ncbi:DUF4381 domain-containing protein [Colwellia sp. MSW7]|uniref:DUF4381 domain-containing protein n=1 Tax=Colwellia maritima TaxID=2912588 RepID=A0ABS9X5N1_9GAMM|nr:DUF4381 domain-containing protein [Colwellia maritima]MCI2285547.1 DUF4381 domain-containing protein [Colwellia maritima]